MALWYIVFAAGLFIGNFGSDSIVVGSKKFFVIGPHCPCGSMTKANRAVLACSSSVMVVSPRIVVEVTGSVLLVRMYFFRSIDWRCCSAVAVI